MIVLMINLLLKIYKSHYIEIIHKGMASIWLYQFMIKNQSTFKFVSKSCRVKHTSRTVCAKRQQIAFRNGDNRDK